MQRSAGLQSPIGPERIMYRVSSSSLFIILPHVRILLCASRTSYQGRKSYTCGLELSADCSGLVVIVSWTRLQFVNPVSSYRHFVIVRSTEAIVTRSAHNQNHTHNEKSTLLVKVHHSISLPYLLVRRIQRQDSPIFDSYSTACNIK